MRNIIITASLALLAACASSSPSPRRSSSRPVRVSSQEPMSVAGSSDKNEKRKLRIRCVMGSCLLEPNTKVVKGTDFDFARNIGSGKTVCPPKDKPQLGIDATYLEVNTNIWVHVCLHYKFDPKK